MLRDIPRTVGSDFVAYVVFRWFSEEMKVGRQIS